MEFILFVIQSQKKIYVNLQTSTQYQLQELIPLWGGSTAAITGNEHVDSGRIARR